MEFVRSIDRTPVLLQKEIWGFIVNRILFAASEEAQMVHNNFLQMWSDSGVVGFLAFALLWLVALRDAFQLARQRLYDPAAIAVTMGRAWARIRSACLKSCSRVSTTCGNKESSSRVWLRRLLISKSSRSFTAG